MLQKVPTKKIHIIIFSILPLVLLTILSFYNFTLTNRFLQESENLILGGPLLASLIFIAMQIIYLIFCTLKQQAVRLLYHLLSLIFLSAGIILYFMITESVNWNQVPEGIMNPLQFYILFFTLYVPLCIFHLFEIVRFQNQTAKNKKILWNTITVIGIPVGIYIFYTLVMPYIRWYRSTGVGEHLILLFFIQITFFFFYSLLNLFYKLLHSKKDFYNINSIWINIIIALGLPLIGLSIYNEVLPSSSFLIFGDLSSPLYYIMTILCGMAQIIPSSNKFHFRLLQFSARILFLPFTLYFLIMSLPFIPLSITVLIFVFGVGLLILSPLLLSIIHFHNIRQDIKFFKKHILNSQQKIIPFTLILFFTLPGLYFTDLSLDRQGVKEITMFLNSDYKIKKTSLTRINNILDHIRLYDTNNSWFRFQPFHSFIYNQYVLENMILNQQDLNRLTEIFNPNTNARNFTQIQPLAETQSIKLDSITVESEYNENEAYWESWVHLAIKNSGVNFNEYKTFFDIPQGVYIQDYYLDIEGRREKGLLVEKKSAIWIYNRIVNRRRDPGLLFYHDLNTLSLSVFPFKANEIRTTGFKMIYQEPFELKLDGKKILIGQESKIPEPEAVQLKESIWYFNEAFKASLPEHKRKAAYYLIVDQTNSWSIQDNENIIKNIQSQLLDSSDVQVVLADFQVQDIGPLNSWKKKYKHAKASFYFDKVFSNIIKHHKNSKKNTVPVLLFLKNDFKNTVQIKTHHVFMNLYPELSHYYTWNKKNSFSAYSLKFLSHNQKAKSGHWPIQIKPVRLWKYNNKDYFLHYTNKQIYFLTDTEETFPNDWDSMKSPWKQSAILQSLWEHKPDAHSVSSELSFKIFMESLKSGLLTPYSSYIALETQEQKDRLLKKQKEQLAKGIKNWNNNEELMSMSEPEDWLWLILISALVVIYVLRMKIQTNSREK